MQGMLGKQKRLSRLVNPATGRGFCIAFDHALQLGNCPGVEHPDRTLDTLIEAGVDGVILSLGTMLRYGERLAQPGAPAVILRLDQTTMWRDAKSSPRAYADGHTRLVASVEDAVAVGAEAVLTFLFVGHQDPALETRAFEICAEVGAAARRTGMVHVIETMGARGDGVVDPFSAPLIASHTRIGMELGADVIKTDWPGSPEALRPIAAALPIPILVAGGPSRGSDRGTLQMVADVIAGGAAGILFGRAVFQARNPLAVLKAARRIIHDNASIDEAVEGVGF